MSVQSEQLQCEVRVHLARRTYQAERTWSMSRSSRINCDLSCTMRSRAPLLSSWPRYPLAWLAQSVATGRPTYEKELPHLLKPPKFGASPSHSQLGFCHSKPECC